MRKESVTYWNTVAASGDREARDAVLSGFTTELAFDDAGREDARHLIYPFITPSDVVLDVGCGLGRLLKWAAHGCQRAIGLDVSTEMLRKARQRLAGVRNVTLKRLPVSLRFPVREHSIDFALFYHVSEHLDREDTYTILCEIRRCLCRTGRALVQFSLFDYPDNQEEFLKWVRKDDNEGVRSRFYTEREVMTLLQMVGLYPQIRLFIPGEFAVVVTTDDKRLLGQMPLISLPTASGLSPAPSPASLLRRSPRRSLVAVNPAGTSGNDRRNV